MSRRSSAQVALDLAEERIGDIELALASAGHAWVVGVDEAGRGPLAGPVVVAAVALPLPPPDWCVGLDDSKRLKAGERERWNAVVRGSGMPQRVVHVDAAEVDRRNVLQASLDGMRTAVSGLLAEHPFLRGAPVLVDGNRPFGGLSVDERPIVRGDARCFSIAAASVLAKVERDATMVALATEFAEYGFERHFGYPTPAHLRALRALGPCPAHRMSYGPVRAAAAALRRGIDATES